MGPLAPHNERNGRGRARAPFLPSKRLRICQKPKGDTIRPTAADGRTSRTNARTMARRR